MQSTKNAFLRAVSRYDFLTENGALSHSSSGSALVDYFAKCGTYRDRDENEVFTDIARIWEDSPLIALMIIFYMRTVTRQTKGLFASETVQKGMGAKDEFRKAIKWLAVHQPETLYANLWLIPVVGAWGDLWHDDLRDVLDQQQVFALIKRGLEDEASRALIAKFLPRIRSIGQTYNERHRARNKWAYALCDELGWQTRDYRKFKSAPAHTAHQFQRDMSQGRWDQIDFNKLPGRALFKLASKRGREDKLTILERHKQVERYVAWLEKQPTAKFTGYVYELFIAATSAKVGLAEKMTFDKQFGGLLELAKADRGGIDGNIWCALDTSGSMTMPVVEGISAYDICVSLGIYFSSLNEGAFKDNVVMFDNTSRTLQLSGTFTDKVNQIKKASVAWGGTNFQSVIDLMVQVRKKNPKIPVEDFPQTLLVVSDMQFNPVDGNTETNYERAMEKLAEVGLPKINIVWWWVTGRGQDFPSTIDQEGVTMIGGFDGSIIELILGGNDEAEAEVEAEVAGAEEAEATEAPTKTKRTAYDNMLLALDQEVLKQLRVV